MIRRSVSTIQVDSNLEVSKVFGLKVGLAAGKSGMSKVALLETTEDILNLLRLNPVLIMVIEIQDLNIQIVFVVGPSFIVILARKEKKVTMNLAIITLVISELRTEKAVRVFGLVVIQKKEMANHARKKSISLLNGQKKMLKNTSLISLLRILPKIGKVFKLELILNYMVDTQAISEILNLMYPKILPDLNN